MHRTLLSLAALAFTVAFGCDKIIGRTPVAPDFGPLEGNTEVSIYVSDCGDHRDVKKVLIGTQVQTIVSQKEDEVKIRTTASTEEGTFPVKLLLSNNRTCDTGFTFRFQKMEQSTINYLSDRSHAIGERRMGGWRPDQPSGPAVPVESENPAGAESPTEPPAPEQQTQ